MLALLWWAWGGYAWLTSLIDPEEGPVRLLMFGAMAATVVAVAVRPRRLRRPRADVRPRLRRAARRPPRALRGRRPAACRRCGGRSPSLAVSTAIGLGLLIVASFTDGWVRGLLWAVALAARHRRPVRQRLERLDDAARALQRALRAVRPDRPRRVGRGHRRRRRGRRHVRGRGGRRPRRGARRRRCGGCTSTSSAPSPPSGWPRPRPARRRTTSAATPGRTCTSR